MSDEDIKERWAPLSNRWHDPGTMAHLLRANNSPSCGAVYFSSPGPFEGSDNMPRCRTCTKLAESRRKNQG